MPTDEQKLWGVWGRANGLYSSWAASKNINYYLLFVLYALEGETAVTQKKICMCTGLTKQTVNSVIRSLKENGYIELAKGHEDRREKQILLTEKGAAYSSELLTPLRRMERRVLEIMGSDRVREMVDNIALFNTVLEKEMEKEV
ncbi:MAG: MarR family transcriptional regulator [Dorea sp.]|nr:MarR family transcriptional regulator [Dorea sp.]